MADAVRACSHGMGAKTASYAVMHLCVAILVAYALTQDWRQALAIGIVEPIVQTLAFALHDRFWTRRQSARAGPAPVEAGGRA